MYIVLFFYRAPGGCVSHGLGAWDTCLLILLLLVRRHPHLGRFFFVIIRFINHHPSYVFSLHIMDAHEVRRTTLVDRTRHNDHGITALGATGGLQFVQNIGDDPIHIFGCEIINQFGGGGT
jgi:hypothetical protein